MTDGVFSGQRIVATDERDAIVVLSSGVYFVGKGIGKVGTTSGEVCFNTGMTGYQEVLTDPSYAGQIINFTFSHIGNVGCNDVDMEADKVVCRGLILRTLPTLPSNYRGQIDFQDWLVKHEVTGIVDIDTRAITKHIRESGVHTALIVRATPGEIFDIDQLLAEVRQVPILNGVDLASKVCTRQSYHWQQAAYNLQDADFNKASSDKRVVVIDYGCKRSILRCLVEVGCDVHVVPATASFEEVMAHRPDGVFLSNGPADPFAAADFAVPVIQKIIEAEVPVFGICLGNQLLALACGLKTVRMPQGHRGANHPVKNLQTGQIEITSQNHGFCISGSDVPDTVEITHLSLFDGSVEGIRLKHGRAFSVQYHPESSPGPHDSFYLFKNFVRMMNEVSALQKIA